MPELSTYLGHSLSQICICIIFGTLDSQHDAVTQTVMLLWLLWQLWTHLLDQLSSS